MNSKVQYLKTKFILGSISIFVGFVGATIALFQWAERTGVKYLFGDYAQYVLGFGGFAAMIFGAFLVNDAWVLRDVLTGKYETPTSYTTYPSPTIWEEIEAPGETSPETETFIPETNYRDRTMKQILRSYESDKGTSSRLRKLLDRLLRRKAS